MRHGEVSRGMFPTYEISAITNGVHATTWTSAAFTELFDSYIPGWRADNNYLRYAISIPLPSIRQAHAEAKAELFEEIGRSFGVQLDPKVFTARYARLLEELIREHPADWTWTHRRWKISCPYQLSAAHAASQ